jgi:hypothetical protein
VSSFDAILFRLAALGYHSFVGLFLTFSFALSRAAAVLAV